MGMVAPSRQTASRPDDAPDAEPDRAHASSTGSDGEAAVPVAVGVSGPILLPQQLAGGVFVPLQLFVQVRKVWQRALGSRLAVLAGCSRKQPASSSASDISAGNGQLKPAAMNRVRYSCTVSD
jgi:hypothetical protein